MSDSFVVPTRRSALPQQVRPAHQPRPTNAFDVFAPEAVEQSIADRFEQQVRRHPERLAIKTRRSQLTYADLNAAANGVAHAILAQCGSHNEPIALLLEQDAVALSAILGVLKAGKCYAMLDPTQPPVRLTALVEHAQASLVVTQTPHLSLAQSVVPAGCDVLNIDQCDARALLDNPGLSLSADLCAALLYTSGSTGQPKGVMQSHRTVLHRVMMDTNVYHICPDDRLLFLQSFTFSASLRTIFGALLNGTTLYPYPIKDEGLAPLSTWLRQEGITLFYAVPTIFRYVANECTAAESFPACRLIYLGGEPVLSKDVELYRQHFAPHCLLVNALSSGEAGTIRQYFIDKQTPMSDNVVPVGYAVVDKEVMLLDEAGAEVGHDGVGEIVVKSRYLSPGYWRQPELTQAAFQPALDGSDTRIYRTGDLGLMRPDGCLVHLGRQDRQVKIRGHRLDMAEIEAVLLKHPELKDAVVIPQEYRPGEYRLVAYLAPIQLPGPTADALRRFGQEQLPSYMVPATCVLCEILPRTHTGKVDHQALLLATQGKQPLLTPFVAPRTPVEAALAQIWAEVLGLTQVGIHDNFLALGGHSLLAAQIMSRVCNIWHVEVHLRELLEAPTVAEMAVVIVQYQATQLLSHELDRLLAEVEHCADEDTQRQLDNDNV